MAAPRAPLEAELWSDQAGRLLRLSIPAQSVEIVREDIASVAARRVTISRANDEQVTIPANGFSLAGTISKPLDAGPAKLPAVVLVGGSGPTDRDEDVYGIPIFGQLASALADGGYLVLRYDKRGVGQSGGRAESATLNDFAEDVRAVVKFLGDRKDVDDTRIVVVGHSEGGSVAMIAASKEKRIDGLVLIGTIGETGAELNMAQVAHALDLSGKPDAEKQATLALQKKIQTAVLTGAGLGGHPAAAAQAGRHGLVPELPRLRSGEGDARRPPADPRRAGPARHAGRAVERRPARSARAGAQERAAGRRREDAGRQPPARSGDHRRGRASTARSRTGTSAPP